MPLSIWSLEWNVNRGRMNTWMSAPHGWTSRALESKPLCIGIAALARKIEPWLKAAGTGYWSGCQDLNNWHTVKGYRLYCRWMISERQRVTWKVIRWRSIVYTIELAEHLYTSGIYLHLLFVKVLGYHLYLWIYQLYL